MVKKINNDAWMIKKLLRRGLRQCEIARLLDIKKEKVWYWSKTEIKESQIKKKKLKDIYIRAIQKWANNKVTSQRSSRKIAAMINSVLANLKEVDKNGRPLTVHYTTVNNYLKEYFGRPRKIRKVFFLSKEQMIKRKQFCQMILDKKIKPEQIFFTDESLIDLGSFSHDLIRLDPLKKWDESTYTLLNRPQKKFEKSLMIAGGINFYGLSRLIFLDGTMNEFSYGQALLFYKDDIEKIEREHQIKIIFEQDGASSHRSKSNLFLLDKLFTKGGWIQNPPNSPDLAYPIEKLWGIIKPRVRRRNPKSIDELKKYLLEEWNAVPEEMVKNLCKGYLKRIKKVLELNGARIEPEYFKKNEKVEYEWKIPKDIPTQRIIYNNEQLKKYKEREIKILKKGLKEKKIIHSKRMKSIGKIIQSFRKRDLKNLSIGRAISIIRKRQELLKEKKNSKEYKLKLDEEFKKKIGKLSKMNIFQYLRHLNGDEDEEEGSDNESNSTNDGFEDKIKSLEELIKENGEIKYKKI